MSNFTNITTQTTTVVKSGSGTLEKIIVNTPLANGTITIYDSYAAVGTKVGTVTFPASLTSSGPVCVDYNVQCDEGIVIVTGSANLDLTVVYS